MAAEQPVGQAFNAAAKYVLTRGNPSLDWQGSHRLGDIDAVNRLKATDGPDLFVWGSSTLYPQLLAAGLLDWLHLLTYPLTLGRGKRLFGNGTPALRLALVKSAVSASGVFIATYEPNGEVTTGTYPSPGPSGAERDRRARMARDDPWQQTETR